MMSAEWVWICCVREFKCVDLRAVNRRTRTRLPRTREMGGGRRRQRTGLRTVSVVSILVCVQAHTFDQRLLCDPSWVIADERACARTHTDLFSAVVLQACMRRCFVQCNNTEVTVSRLIKRTRTCRRSETQQEGPVQNKTEFWQS